MKENIVGFSVPHWPNLIALLFFVAAVGTESDLGFTITSL